MRTNSPRGRGPHMVAVEATHERNPDAGQRWVWLDVFDVGP